MVPKRITEETLFEKRKSNKSFEIDFENKKIGDLIDGKNAVKQAVKQALLTQRYKYPIFSHAYGTDYKDAFEDGYMKAMGRVKNAICDSLLCDERISSVDSFEFERKGTEMIVSFKVRTIYGDMEHMEEINYD